MDEKINFRCQLSQMKTILFLLLVTLTLSARSQNQIHLYDTTLNERLATSSAKMTGVIKESANWYSKYAPVPRFAQLDYAFGADASENKKLAGNGVLYIPSLNFDKSEYPIKRVYAKTTRGIIELEKLGELNIGNSDPEIVKVFGKNRVDYYYLLPYWITKEKCELMIDWSTNRKEFTITKFPDNSELGFASEVPQNQKIDNQFLMEFLKREFGLTSR